MDQDHTAQFISALANLEPGIHHAPATAPPAPDGALLAFGDNDPSLDGWSVEQLKSEVVRLRRALASALRLGVADDALPLPTTALVDNVAAVHDALLPHLASFAQPFAPTATPVPAPAEGRKRALDGEDDAGGPSSRRTTRASKRDSGTGKRVERGRRVELGRAIRTKMRYAMNIGLDDDLPQPTAITLPDASPDHGYWVPNWSAGVSDGHNAQWLDRVCAVFIAEARSLQAWNKVPAEDLADDIVKVGCGWGRVALTTKGSRAHRVPEFCKEIHGGSGPQAGEEEGKVCQEPAAMGTQGLGECASLSLLTTAETKATSKSRARPVVFRPAFPPIGPAHRLHVV